MYPPEISAKAITEALVRCGVNEVVTTPDFLQLSLHDRLMRLHPHVRTTYSANENQALHVAAGLFMAGRQPLVMMQNQGLHNCCNSLRTCGLDAGLPLVMMIGQFGREFSNVGKDSRQSSRRMVNLLLPILDAMGVKTWTIDHGEEVGRVEEAWAESRRASAPAAIVIGHYTAWD